MINFDHVTGENRQKLNLDWPQYLDTNRILIVGSECNNQPNTLATKYW